MSNLRGNKMSKVLGKIKDSKNTKKKKEKEEEDTDGPSGSTGASGSNDDKDSNRNLNTAGSTGASGNNDEKDSNRNLNTAGSTEASSGNDEKDSNRNLNTGSTEASSGNDEKDSNRNLNTAGSTEASGGNDEKDYSNENLNTELERILNRPQESSFHSIVPQTSNSNDGKEEIRMSEEELQQPTRDALVRDVILPKVYVMDAISRHLDMSCKGIQNWRHLASLNDVSENLQLKCQAGEHHSRSEKMFELLLAENPDLLIGTLKKHLRVLKINIVEPYIQKLNLRDDDKVADILESSYPDIPGRILLMLDLLPDDTWKNLGEKLGVNRERLKHIKTDCANQQENPAGHVINIIYRKEPRMSIEKFEKYLTDIGRSDVAKKLDKIPGKGTIYDLHKDLDLMRDVTSMLNGADNSLIKNYKDLADICGIPIDEYESLQPPSAESPTKAVLDDIVRRKPTFTVEELFTNFRDMKREDVINAISPYFVGKEDKSNW